MRLASITTTTILRGTFKKMFLHGSSVMLCGWESRSRCTLERRTRIRRGYSRPKFPKTTRYSRTFLRYRMGPRSRILGRLLVDLPSATTSTDTHSLLHRLSRIRTAFIESFPQPVHRHHWYVVHVNVSTPDGSNNRTSSVFFLGVITFSSNENTSHLVRQMFAAVQLPLPRIILETDAPFMIPANIYGSLPAVKGRLPLCHTAMIPWTAEVVAALGGEGWDVDRVLELGKTNAHNVYGI